MTPEERLALLRIVDRLEATEILLRQHGDIENARFAIIKVVELLQELM